MSAEKDMIRVHERLARIETTQESQKKQQSEILEEVRSLNVRLFQDNGRASLCTRVNNNSRRIKVVMAALVALAAGSAISAPALQAIFKALF